MNILLDAHISGRTVGKALTENGHDVRAIDSEPELEGLSDPEVLELAAAEGRILVTANMRDFEPLLRESSALRSDPGPLQRKKRSLQRPHHGRGGDARGHRPRRVGRPRGVAAERLTSTAAGRSADV